MLERLIVLAMILDYVIEAKINHFIRTDTSVPELEIDKRKYTNPVNMKKITEVAEKTGDVAKTDVDKFSTQDNSLRNSLNAEEIEPFLSTNKEKKESPPRGINKDDTMPFSMKIIDFDEDLNEHEADLKDPNVISISSYNIPKIPKKVYGPQKKPFKPLPFSGVGPAGIDDVDKPSCNAFSRTARFNPFSVLDARWFNFYRWTSDNTPLLVEFNAPTSWEIEYIRSHLDQAVERPVSWSSQKVIMVDLIYNASALLVERGDHGQFWMYPIMKNYTRRLEPLDVRFKQTADNRYFGFVICEDDRAFIFSRINDVPRKNEIPDVVAKVGWRGRDGRSYLYEGHKWAPIPEMSEEEYWKPPKLSKEEELPPPPPEDDPEEEPIKFLNKNYQHKTKK